MKKIFKLLALAALVVAASSCAKSRAEQMRLANNIKIQCNPEVLALVGDKIPADLTVTYPEGYFSPTAVMVVTPVLVYEGGEQTGTAFVYQGEKVKDNYKVVAKAGGTVKEHVDFAYAKGVEKSHLELRSIVYYGKKRLTVPAIKVADGVICTQNLISKDGHYSMKDDGYQYVIRSSVEGQIMYDVNSANVKNSELRSQSIKDLQAALEAISEDPRYTVAGNQIVAYASPEGGQKLNAKLSDKRAASAQKAWDKVSGKKDATVEVKSVGQDWEGFQEAIEKSNLEDKDLILRVLSMYSDPAIREKEIKNMSQVYTDISKNVFPDLRRARFITEVDYQNFTDSELEELAEKAIGTLDETALLKVAANSDNVARKESLYKRAVDKFNSDKAKFNLAVLALNANDPDKAASYLNKINAADDPDVINAKGVCNLQKGNIAAASTLFKNAGTPEAKANLGVLDVLNGKYADAVTKLAGSEGNDAAVAYILNNQLDKAAAAIKGDCAKADYLRAIIAARKGDKANARGYANQAVSKDPSLKEAITNDAEFAKYFD